MIVEDVTEQEKYTLKNKVMTRLKGKLTFISLFHPINLEMEDGELDLRVQIFETFDELNGEKTSMDYGKNNIHIYADEKADKVMKFHHDDIEGETVLMMLDVPNAFGFKTLELIFLIFFKTLTG